MKKFATWKRQLSFNENVSSLCRASTEQVELLPVISSLLFGLILTLIGKEETVLSSTRRGEHNANVVEEFLDVFLMEHENSSFSSCGFMIND